MNPAEIDPKEEIQLYLEYAQEMISAGRLMVGSDFYGSACNRSYYAIFYAASALLSSQGFAYGKHSAVISAFRKNFIKSGEFDVRWSQIYERIMSHRQSSDYDIHVTLEKEQALVDLKDANEFVLEVTEWLQKKKFI